MTVGAIKEKENDSGPSRHMLLLGPWNPELVIEGCRDGEVVKPDVSAAGYSLQSMPEAYSFATLVLRAIIPSLHPHVLLIESLLVEESQS